MAHEPRLGSECPRVLEHVDPSQCRDNVKIAALNGRVDNVESFGVRRNRIVDAFEVGARHGGERDQ